MTTVSSKPDLSGADTPAAGGSTGVGAAAAKVRTAAKTRPGALAETGSPLLRPPAAAHLSDEQVAELGRELDAIKDDILAKRGASDAAYIRRMIKIQRGLELSGRALLLVSKKKPAWIAGTTLLSFAKILENMELGHNILHGQWDWMRDPDIHSTTWEWDFVTPARSWQHTHNDLHHRWTNVIGKDNDVGYNLLRMDPQQEWKPFNLGNPLYNALLAPVFEWGIAIYDLELVDYKEGKKSKEALTKDLKALGRKALKQFTKDYAATPAVAMLTGSGKQALYGTLTANAVRNVWAHAVIFCGHFPDGHGHLHRGNGGRGDPRGLVRAADDRLRQHLRFQVHAPDDRQSFAPDRAPPLPGHSVQPLRRGGAEGSGDLQAVRPAVHHRPDLEAGRLHLGQGLQTGPAAQEGLGPPARVRPDGTMKKGRLPSRQASLLRRARGRAQACSPHLERGPAAGCRGGPKSRSAPGPER